MQSHHSIEMLSFKSQKSFTTECYNYLTSSGAEGNYIVGTLINDLNTGHVISLSSKSLLGVTLGWNYIDGVYSCMMGMKQLLDEDDYRRTQNKIKGILNIISGVQLFLFSYNPMFTSAIGLSGGAALASPSFALAMLCDFLNASIDFYQACQEVEFEGWIKERVKQVNYLEKRIEKIENKLNENNENKNLIAKKIKLEAKREKILLNMGIRSRVYNKAINSGEKPPLSTDFETLLSPLKSETKNKINFDAEPSQLDIEIDKSIQQKCTNQYREGRKDVIFKGFSFIGMSLLAAAPIVLLAAGVPFPPLLILGLGLTSMVALHYTIKHGDKLLNKFDQVKTNMKQRFFKPHIKPIENIENNIPEAKPLLGFAT